MDGDLDSLLADSGRSLPPGIIEELEYALKAGYYLDYGFSVDDATGGAIFDEGLTEAQRDAIAEYYEAKYEAEYEDHESKVEAAAEAVEDSGEAEEEAAEAEAEAEEDD